MTKTREVLALTGWAILSALCSASVSLPLAGILLLAGVTGAVWHGVRS